MLRRFVFPPIFLAATAAWAQPPDGRGEVTRNYGVAIDKLASDTRVIRASDPDTLDKVIEQSRRNSCPDDDKDSPPAFVPPPSGNGDLFAYGVAGALGLAAVVVLATSKPASSERRA